MITRLTSFLSGPDVCPQLGNKHCPHYRESRIGDSSVFGTFLHLPIVGSLQRASDEAHLWCLASKDNAKIASDCQHIMSTKMASSAEEAGQLTNRAMKKGKGYPNASTV